MSSWRSQARAPGRSPSRINWVATPSYAATMGDLGLTGGVHQEVGLNQEPVTIEQQRLRDPIKDLGPVRRFGRSRHSDGELVGDQRGPLVVEGEEQFFKAGELRVEGAAGVAGFGADILDTGVSEAFILTFITAAGRGQRRSVTFGFVWWLVRICALGVAA